LLQNPFIAETAAYRDVRIDLALAPEAHANGDEREYHHDHVDPRPEQLEVLATIVAAGWAQ
jgi:hypothetical protein